MNKLELQMTETVKVFGSTKNLIGKTKNGKKSLELAEVVLAKYDLLDNHCQQNLKYYALLRPIYLILLGQMLI